MMNYKFLKPLIVFLCVLFLYFKSNGKPLLQEKITFVVSKNNSPHIKQALEELIPSLLKVSNLSSVKIGSTVNKTGLNILVRVDSTLLGAILKDEDGFIIRKIDSSTVLISGGTDIGTEFGIYEYFERCLGFVWLMPSDLWLEIPENIASFLPKDDIISIPAYVSREFSPLDINKRDSKIGLWARRNKLNMRTEFHHNMNLIFKNLKDSNFIASHNGQREIPNFDIDENWQPNFEAKGISDFATEAINKYFNKNKHIKSFSLGVNDSYRFELEGKARVNSIGLINQSEFYYNWVRKVVDGVNMKYPDKEFGLLAYLNVYDPPSFRLPNNVVPYITYERTKWVDRKCKSSDLDRLNAWKAVSANIGWYDYIYGLNYLIPRPQTNVIGDYLRIGANLGVKYYYAEYYPNWIDGPKGWIITKMLWDPSLDAGELKEKWFNKAFGTVGNDMQKFYDLWENYWNNDMPKSKWWNDKLPWLPFNDLSYLNEIPEDYYKKSNQYLKAAYEKSNNKKYSDRVAFIREMFDFQRLVYYYKNKKRDPFENQKVTHSLIEDRLQKLRDYEINDVFYIKYKELVKL